MRVRSKRLLSLAIVLAGCLLFAVRGYRDQRETLQSFDFKPVYSGARCLIDGCDPYDSAVLQREFLAHGGDPHDLRPFRRFNANYPPSALALLTPLALLPFGPAHLLWLGLSIGLFSTAALLVGSLCARLSAVVAPTLLAALVATSTMLLMLGQPAGPVLGLLGIAVWCLLRGGPAWISVPCFALSLTLKPHLGALVWLFFLLARSPQSDVSGADTSLPPPPLSPAALYRRRALQILAGTVLISLPGLAWASLSPATRHWPQELRRNLQGIAGHGQPSDPGPANDEAHDITSLQAAFSVVEDRPAFYNAASFGVSGLLLIAWLLPVVRRPPSLARDLLALAAVSALTLLPVYHRQYDTRLLLLSFPAVALLLARSHALGGRSRAVGWTAAIGSAVCVVVTTHNFPQLVRAGLPHAAFGTFGTIVLLRPMPVALLLLTVFYLACLYRCSPQFSDGSQHLPK